MVFAGIDHIPFEFLGDFAGFILRSLFLVVSSSLIALGISMWVGAKLLGTRKWALALHAEQRPEDGFVSVDMTVRSVVGKVGMASTDLRPAGKVIVDNEIYDAVTLWGDYITKGTAIVVKKYQSGQVYVEKV